MINKIGQIMLYVNDQEQAVNFWTKKVGFTVIAEVNENGMRWIEIAPSMEAETTIILHDKQVIAKMSPELHLGTPSIMFVSEHFDQLYNDLKKHLVFVGEMVEMPSGRVFNFCDSEQNYFAVMEKK